MIKQEIQKIRHQLPELSEWNTQDIELLDLRVKTLKSQWSKATCEQDDLLTLGAALSWSERSNNTPGFPILDKTPSQYIETGRVYRQKINEQVKSLAEKAQAWGGFWDPEDEKKEDEEGWKERGTSIAPHVWIGLKKRGFLPHINSPLDYERESLKGLEECCKFLLKLPVMTPSIETMQKAHGNLFKNISNQAGEFTDAQLFSGGYIGADPRLISYELENLTRQFEKGIKTAKKMGSFKEAEIIRTVTFVAARLLRIQPFKEGNKRIIAAWALSTLAREVSIPKRNDIDLYKSLHLTFKELRKGKLAPMAKKLCKAVAIENPEHEVPSFWLSPDFVAPKQIDPKEWEKKTQPYRSTSNLAPKIIIPKGKYKEARTKQREEELQMSGLYDYNLH
jgi:hypothetical protein